MHLGLVVEADFAVVVVLVEDGGEVGEHGGVVGVAGGRGVGGGEETALELGEVEDLLVGIGAELGDVGVEEIGEDFGGELAVVNGGVIGGVAGEELFVGAEEGGGVGEAIVPDEGAEAGCGGWAKDAVEFRFGARAVEPVEGLAGDDEVYAVVREGGGFGGGGDAGEAGGVAKFLFAGGAHGVVGLDAEDGVAVLQEEAGEQAGAGADVCDDGVGAEGAAAIRSEMILAG